MTVSKSKLEKETDIADVPTNEEWKKEILLRN